MFSKKNRKRLVVDYGDLMGKTVKRTFDGAKFKCVTIQYAKNTEILYVSILRCYDFEHIDNATEYAEAYSYIESFFEIIEDDRKFKDSVILAARTK